MKSRSIEQRLKESAKILEYHHKMIDPLSIFLGIAKTYLSTKNRGERELYLALAEPVYRNIETNQREKKDQVVGQYLSALEELCPELFDKLKQGEKKKK